MASQASTTVEFLAGDAALKAHTNDVDEKEPSTGHWPEGDHKHNNADGPRHSFGLVFDLLLRLNFLTPQEQRQCIH